MKKNLNGAPKRSRTSNRSVRSRVLYPIELWVRNKKNGGERGIRTLDRVLPYTPLAGARLQPLGHLTAIGLCGV